MFRTVLFWLHLTAGVVAGAIILLMSATGVALTYERQINEWSTSHLKSIPPSPGARPLTAEALLAEVTRAHPDVTIVGLTVNQRADAPVTVLTDAVPRYVSAYTGADLGERRGARLREFMSSMRAWHRWLAVEGEQRAVARAVTGYSNLLFLFIVVSGMDLWLPKVLSWPQVRQVLFFKSAYGTSKARDFNWHNVIGIWTSVPLFIVVLGAVPMSFPWANDLLYTVSGEEPPARRPEGPGPGPGRQGGPGVGGGPQAGRGGPGEGRRGGPADRGGDLGQAARPRGESGPRLESSARRGRDGSASATPSVDGLNAAIERARSEQPTWQTVSVRFPRRAEEPLAVAVDLGDGGQPQLRSTVTVSRAGDVTGRETFADQASGRRLRSILRFAHTGEVLGVTGQTVAGLASAGAVVMVWTGLALSFRRFRAWRARRTPIASGSRPDFIASAGRS